MSSVGLTWGLRCVLLKQTGGLMEEIKLALKTKDTLAASLLEGLQGNLKTLTEENYKKLKKELLTDGFSFAVHVWEDATTGKIYIIDGHQRVAALKRASSEGIKIPQVPVIFIEADDLNHAKKKVLAAASQYGKFDQLGAQDFIQTIQGINLSDLTERFVMPDISFDTMALTSTIVESHERMINQFKETDFPDLANEPEPEFKQATFILHKDQLDELLQAIALSKNLEDIPTPNQNSNGNALHKIVRQFLMKYGAS